jgi:uncharacterized pyridoxal phosphate-containing UPF0001 family protein
MKNIKIVGLMGMATFTDNQNQIKEFLHLKIFLTLQHSKKSQLSINYLSMGMSGIIP